MQNTAARQNYMITKKDTARLTVSFLRVDKKILYENPHNIAKLRALCCFQVTGIKADVKQKGRVA